MSSTTSTTSAQGSPGTFTGILNSITTDKVRLPLIGAVPIIGVVLGVGLLYFGVFHKKKQYAIIKV